MGDFLTALKTTAPLSPTLRTLPAAGRYARLLAKFPAVLQRVASEHIASHLGGAPETLGRRRGWR